MTTISCIFPSHLLKYTRQTTYSSLECRWCTGCKNKLSVFCLWSCHLHMALHLISEGERLNSSLSLKEFTVFLLLFITVMCCKSCNFMSKMENLTGYGHGCTNSMTHHIFGGWLQSIPFLCAGENSGTAKTLVLPTGDEAPRAHCASTQATRHALGKKRCCQST